MRLHNAIVLGTINVTIFQILECGYRHLDTAKRYGVEQYLGQAIKDSGVNRDDIFLTTKLWPKDYGIISTRKAAFESMKRLDTDYLDMYMLHFPGCPSYINNEKEVLQDTWRELELLLDSERVRSIGVSNFSISDLENLVSEETSGLWPHVNQLEFHPYQHNKALIKYLDYYDIQFGGYCPLAKGRILNEVPVQKVAKMVGKSPAQVLIRWSIQHNALTIPKSTKKHRVMENIKSLDFELPNAAMTILDELHSNLRVVDLDGVRQRLEQDMPDGYKMKNSHCILPKF